MKNIFLIILFSAAVVLAQVNEQTNLTGNLSYDSKIINYNGPVVNKYNFDIKNKKSPFLAAALSLVLPGAGEVYTEHYLKAGIFLVIEAAAITTGIIYDNKGNDQTNVFQNYADENWSVLRYAQWLITYKNAPPEIIKSNNPNIPDWEEVDWALLNQYETGSHNLPQHGEQQYYEMIGKYHQYASGWDDFSGGANENIISSNFTHYAGLRGKANDYYNVAAKAVIVIYINHVLSAVDAAFSAKWFNDDLALRLRVEQNNYSYNRELYPVVNLSYKF